MKYKTQETEPKEQEQQNPILEQVRDLIVLNQQFGYAVSCYKSKQDKLDFCMITHVIDYNFNDLLKLYVALNNDHEYPQLKSECKPVSELKDLIELEETYYNSLVNLGNKGLEENNSVLVAYVIPLIRQFEHTFCKLDESDSAL